MRVPAVSTPLDATEATTELEGAWFRRFGEPVRPDVLALLLALWDLETDAGRAQSNFNFGNIIATSEDQRHYVGDDSGNTRRFRAYLTPSAGADSFVAQLTSDTREEWRAGLDSGDPTEFARALGGLNGGHAYYEAPVERYTRTLVGRWQRYAPTVGSDVGNPLGGAVNGVVLTAVIAMLGAVAWAVLRPR